VIGDDYREDEEIFIHFDDDLGVVIDLAYSKRAELKKLLNAALNIEPHQKPAWALWLADKL
jgi:hypothetical protein